MATLIDEVRLGAAKGTGIEEAVDTNFKRKTSEIGLYLAMSLRAFKVGYPEVADTLELFAIDAAWHAAHFAELNGLVSESTKENLEKMLVDKEKANKGERRVAIKAKEIGCDPAHDFFDESSRDEGRHANALEGLLKRYFS